MKDRYLFRGKRKDNGEWIFGNLIQTDDGVYIIQNYVPRCESVGVGNRI